MNPQHRNFIKTVNELLDEADKLNSKMLAILSDKVISDYSVGLLLTMELYPVLADTDELAGNVRVAMNHAREEALDMSRNIGSAMHVVNVIERKIDAAVAESAAAGSFRFN